MTTANRTIECTPSQLTKILRTCYKSSKLIPFIQGPPGVGKSSGVDAFAAEIDADNIDVRLCYHGPQDIQGFPYLDTDEETGKKRMNFSTPAFWPSGKRKSVLKFEEVNTATKSVFNSMMQLTLERRIGSHALPDNTFIVLLGNRPEDRCGVEKLPAALADRVQPIIVRPDLDEWIRWGQRNGIDPLVTSFLRFRPELLLTFNGAKWDGISSFATPRSWEKASDVVKYADDAHTRHVLLEGTLGSGVAAEFLGYLAVYEKLPDLDGVLLNPEKAKVPTDPSTIYATCAGLAKRVQKKTMPALLTYLDRLPKEFSVFGLKTAVTHNTELMNTSAFTSWVSENREIFA
jgi:hypothetical protein